MTAIALTILFISGYAHSQAYRLEGRVADDSGTPIVGANVTLEPNGKQTLTSDQGIFAFDGLTDNDYTLAIRKSGYEHQTVPATIAGRNHRVDIQLVPIVHVLEEVLVLENPIRRRKQEESMNVEVIGRDFIQRNLGGSLMTTLERLPGIQTIGIGSGQSKPLIRGLGFNRLVVVDQGIKHEGQQWGVDHGLELDQFAAGEVELIKGAASFIYGSDAIAGVVDVRPVAIPYPHHLRGEVTLIGKSNNGQYGTSVSLGGRGERWFIDGRATYQRYGDYRVPTDTVYIYDYPVDLHRQRLRNTAGYDNGLHLHAGFLGKHLRSTIYISNVYSKSGFFANAHGLEPRQVDATTHDRSYRDILLPRQQVNHFKAINRNALSIGQHRLSMELGFQRNFRQEFNNYVNHGYMPANYPDTLGIPRDLEREFDKHVYSLNLRDLVEWGRHSLIFGLNGERQDNAIDGWSFLVPGFKQSSLGSFVYDKYRLSDQWLLHGALRYDHGYLRTATYRDWFPSGGAEQSEYLVRAEALQRRFNSFVWSAGVNYNGDQLEFKANIGKSFRMPIAKELAANGVNYHYFSYERGDTDLSPEESYQADATLSWNSGRWIVKLSPFYNYFPNYIYLNPTASFDYHYGAGNQVFHYAQSRVLRYGGEVELTYRLAKDLDISLLGEYLYAEQLSGDKRGFTLPFSPPPSLLANISWSPKLGTSIQNPYLSIDHRWVGSQHRIVPPERKTEGYGITALQAGATLEWAGRPLHISLQVQNLTNKRYLNHTSFYRLIGLPEASRNIVMSIQLPINFSS